MRGQGKIPRHAAQATRGLILKGKGLWVPRVTERPKNACAVAANPREQMAQWFETPLGKTLARLTLDSVSRLVPPGYYRTGFQAGSARIDLLQRAEQSVFENLPGQTRALRDRGLVVRCCAEQLPFGSRSIDLLALPFVLEFSTDPHSVLREAYSVLAPEGCLVICGFNRWSLWGLRRFLKKGLRRAPWNGRFLSIHQVQDWTRLLGLELTSAESVFYRPPIGRAGLLERLSFLEAAGDRWWPLFSGAYVVVVKKRAFGQPNGFDPASGVLRRQQKPLVSALPRHAAKRRLTVVRG